MVIAERILNPLSNHPDDVRLREAHEARLRYDAKLREEYLHPTTKRSSDDKEFDQVLDWWIANYQAARDKDRKRTLPNNSLDVVKADDLQKYVRIYVTDPDNRSKGAIAFIAKEDFKNKTLGSVRRGDIFFPDSWKKPRPRKVGNMFIDNRQFFTTV